VRAVGSAEIGADRVRLAAGGADFGDQRFGFLGGAAVVNDDAGAGRGERAGGGTADAPRGAGNQSGSADEVTHGGSP